MSQRNALELNWRKFSYIIFLTILEITISKIFIVRFIGLAMPVQTSEVAFGILNLIGPRPESDREATEGLNRSIGQLPFF